MFYRDLKRKKLEGPNGVSIVGPDERAGKGCCWVSGRAVRVLYMQIAKAKEVSSGKDPFSPIVDFMFAEDGTLLISLVREVMNPYRNALTGPSRMPCFRVHPKANSIYMLGYETNCWGDFLTLMVHGDEKGFMMLNLWALAEVKGVSEVRDDGSVVLTQKKIGVVPSMREMYFPFFMAVKEIPPGAVGFFQRASHETVIDLMRKNPSGSPFRYAKEVRAARRIFKKTFSR